MQDFKTMAQVADRLVPSMVAPQALPPGAMLPDYPPGLALAHACMSAVPPDTYRAALQALVTFEQRAALPSITVPTLCLAGEHDKTAPPEVLRRMAQKIPGAQFECIPGVGHLMGFEQEAPFHQAILSERWTTFSPCLAAIGMKCTAVRPRVLRNAEYSATICR